MKRMMSKSGLSSSHAKPPPSVMGASSPGGGTGYSRRLHGLRGNRIPKWAYRVSHGGLFDRHRASIRRIERIGRRSHEREHRRSRIGKRLNLIPSKNEVRLTCSVLRHRCVRNDSNLQDIISLHVSALHNGPHVDTARYPHRPWPL